MACLHGICQERLITKPRQDLFSLVFISSFGYAADGRSICLFSSNTMLDRLTDCCYSKSGLQSPSNRTEVGLFADFTIVVFFPRVILSGILHTLLDESMELGQNSL